MTHKIIPVFIPHEGCPHDCTFCNQKKIAGTQTPPDLEEIQTRVERYLKSNPSREGSFSLAYYGGSFTAIEEARQISLLDWARKAKERGEIHSLRISTRPDYLKEVHVRRLKEFGVDYVEIGVQSTDPQVLTVARRPADPRILKEGVENLNRAGIPFGVQMMLGLPEDSMEKTYRTTLDLLSLRPKSLRIYPCLVLADTQLEAWYREGRYQPLSLEEALEWAMIPYVLFSRRNIPIIRMGLHASASLQGEETLIAGPFHPGFGEMVVSQVYLDLLQHGLEELGKDGSPVRVAADRSRHSKIAGNRSFVLRTLYQRWGTPLKMIHEEGLGADLVLSVGEKRLLLSWQEHVRTLESRFDRKFNARK